MSSKLRNTMIAAILAVVALAVTAGPALASTVGNLPHHHHHHHHHPVPVGSVAGGLGFAAILGIVLLVVQLRRRRITPAKV